MQHTEETHLYHFLFMDKRSTCPKAFSTENYLISNIKHELLRHDPRRKCISLHIQPIIRKIIPAAKYVLFMIDDAINSKSEMEVWGFWRDSRVQNHMTGKLGSEMIRFDDFFIEKNLKILDIVNGTHSSYFMTSDRDIYYIGDDNDNLSNKQGFRKIEYLKQLNIKSIGAGHGFLTILTMELDLYIFNQHGDDNHVTLIDKFCHGGVEIDTFHCFGNHVLLQTREKTNNPNQLYMLRNESENMNLEPKLIEFFSTEFRMNAKCISGDFTYFMVLTISNEIYLVGMLFKSDKVIEPR